LVFAGDTDRSMVRFLGNLGPRGAPGVTGASPGIVAVSGAQQGARKRKKTKICS
jgi:hypothetical protein